MILWQYLNDFLNLLPYRQRHKRKNDIRATLSQRRRILSNEKVKLGSQEVVEQLLQNHFFINAKNIMLYYPMKNEIDLRTLMQPTQGKRFFLPVTHRRSLEVREYIGEQNLKKGRHRIPEPQTPSYKGKLDLIIVPGVGFDHHNHRLGRGGGYYDRFLRKYRHVPKIGVGYKFQLVRDIPTDKHDVQMTQVVLSTSV